MGGKSSQYHQVANGIHQVSMMHMIQNQDVPMLYADIPGMYQQDDKVEPA